MNDKVKESLNILGLKARDKVTGFEGVVTSVSFDLYGCIQAVVNPGLNEEKKLGDAKWFDTNRLEITDEKSIMDLPDFIKVRGPAEKPPMNNF